MCIRDRSGMSPIAHPMVGPRGTVSCRCAFGILHGTTLGANPYDKLTPSMRLLSRTEFGSGGIPNGVGTDGNPGVTV